MHTNNLKWLPLALLFASLLALASCDEELEVYSSEYSDTVVFGIQPDRASRAAADDDAVVSRFYLTDEQNADSMLVSCEVSDMPAFASLAPRTRASYVDNSSMESFGVFAYLATTGVAADTWNWSSFFFTDQEVNRPSDAADPWQMANTYYWFGDDANSLRFFAYSPYDVNATLPASDQAATAPYITYSVPDDAASQTDLMVAVSDVTPGNHNAAASLNFKHLLSAVEFQ